ncbi:DUF742 domain-containing protein [Kitasatospora sp. P5_F3]
MTSPPHWYRDPVADEAEEDAADSMVRPYTVTRGRTAPERDDFSLITVLTTVREQSDEFGAPARPSARGLQPEHRVVLERCRRSAALAEVAAELRLPVSLAKILVADLVSQGLLLARAPLAVAVGGRADLGLLTAVREGLRRL